jgi:cell division protein ZapA (FtsZ GTPase activity inhibitor)
VKDLRGCPRSVKECYNDGMAAEIVQVKVAGRNFRVSSTASASELHTLAREVDAKLASLIPKGKAMPENALLLAAFAFARDLQEERARRVALETKARDLLGRALLQVDRALEDTTESPA